MEHTVSFDLSSEICLKSGFAEDGSWDIVKPKSKSQSPFPTGPKSRPSLKNPKNTFLWTGADTIITWATHPPPTFKHEGVLW